MRTTITIDDAVYREIKIAASRQGCTVGSIIEAAVRELLQAQSSAADSILPIPTFPGAPRPGIDFTRTSALLEEMDLEETHDSVA